MAIATLSPEVVIHYSECGEERVWCSTVSRDSSDGPAAAKDLLKRFCDSIGRETDDETRLVVVPTRLGVQPAEVAPVLGQSLAAFLEHTSRHEDGGYKLRADFRTPSDSTTVLISIKFPYIIPQVVGSNESGVRKYMRVEQFECKTTSTVATLKAMVQRRTAFPVNQMILLLEGTRLKNTELLSDVHDAMRNEPLEAHLVANGALAFVRQEGMGHREPVGPQQLMLQLPKAWRGPRVRLMDFDPEQRLGDFRLSVQSVIGLPPATLQFKLTTSEETELLIDAGNDEETLSTLGITNGCTLSVSSSAKNGTTNKSHAILLDIPTSGSAMQLYEEIAQRLNVDDVASLSLFSGDVPLGRSMDLSTAPLADGCIISVHRCREIEIRFSILSRCTTASSSSSSVAENSTEIVKCYSSDTIEEVRERATQALTARFPENAMRVRGSKVFILERSVWDASGASCNSLAALQELLGYFVPCSDYDRLSCLGVMESDSHLLFVPEHHFSVEVLIHVAEEPCGTRKLRVPGTLHLDEFGKMLKKELQLRPLNVSIDHLCEIEWILGDNEGDNDSEIGSQGCYSKSSDPVIMTSPTRGVAALVGSAAAMTSGKRRSLGGTTPDPKKRRSLSSRLGQPLSDDAFIDDIISTHITGQEDWPGHLLCPISLDVMRDPVVVSGSGNTYDRETIERHFQTKQTDPLTNKDLRRASDRKLVPNNTLKSQVDEAASSRVDLRVLAFFNEKKRRTYPKGDAGIGLWFSSVATSLLSRYS